MERQPTPLLEEIDPDTLNEETKKGEANESSPTSSNSSTSSSNSPILDDNSSTTDEEQEIAEEQPLTEYHAKNYFNSTMGGKDLRVLFAMAVGCNSRELPDHKDPPFSQSKAYHSEVKPDAATLKLEVTRRYQAYIRKGRQPRPTNWKIDKCIEYLMSNPIPTSEKRDLDFLQSELEEWKGIQCLVNESHTRQEDRILHRSWSCDIPYLRLYHTLVEDNIRIAFGKAYHAKTREELDGRNSTLFQDFYELAAKQFNDGKWIPDSLVLPDLHEDYARSKPLPLNVAPITADQFKKKLNDNRYKMVKVIADWERSGAGAGMINNVTEGDNDEEKDDDATETQHDIQQQRRTQSETQQYEFIDGDDRKSFLRERPPHILYLWHISHQYSILTKVRQQLNGDFVVDGKSAPSVDTSSARKRKHTPSTASASEGDGLNKNMEQIADSINGLVYVARQSQQTQQINILHRRRKELEDAIQSLDVSCMELELKMLEETSGRKKDVYRRMFTKKKEEVEQNKKELGKTTKLISNKENSAPTSTATVVATPVTMPRFVNVDGDMSDDDNGKNNSNTDGIANE